jgi:hypothetical protein
MHDGFGGVNLDDAIGDASDEEQRPARLSKAAIIAIAGSERPRRPSRASR